MLLCKQIYVSTDQYVVLKHLLQLVLLTFVQSKIFRGGYHLLPRGSLLLVYMYLCSSKSNYNTTQEHYEPF